MEFPDIKSIRHPGSVFFRAAVVSDPIRQSGTRRRRKENQVFVRQAKRISPVFSAYSSVLPVFFA
jgi:hypothetical protein